MQTCAKCSRETDKVVFKNKNRVMKDSKVKPIYWCSECIALANQLTCIFKEAPELRSAYATIDKESLMQEYKEKNKNAIKAKLVQVLESKTSVSQETTFKGMGEWLDEYDIMEKYKSKPWQAQNIIETARQFKHPTRGCVLYEDLNYDSTELSQATQDLVDHMKLETNNTERLSKKIKVEKDEGPKKKRKEIENGKPLTEAQAKSMAKLQKRTTNAVELLDSTLKAALAEKLQDYIPRPRKQKGEIFLAETRSSLAETEVCLQDGRCGRARNIQTNAKAKVEAAVAMTTKLQTLMDAAEDGVNEQ